MKIYIPILLLFLFAPTVSRAAAPADTSSFRIADCECPQVQKIKNTHNIEGYLDRISYSPGQRMVLYGHSLNKYVKVQLVRFTLAEEVLRQIDSVPFQMQDYTNCSFKFGCNWNPTYSFKLDNNQSSGYYALKLISKGNYSYVPFIVKPKSTSETKILVVASTNTWQAYNEWGGASFYKFSNENPCQIRYSQHISFQRPFSNITVSHTKNEHLLSMEWNLAQWLIRENYDFDVISDEDFHTDSSYASTYQVLIITPHPEYWSKEMYNNLERFIEKGKNIMYLGGNGVYWKVTLCDGQMECRKDTMYHEHTGEKGGQWRDLGRPESAVLGIQYDNRGIASYAPYRVMYAKHWAFEGTGLSDTSTFGKQTADGSMASGHESDKCGPATPPNTILLAKGLNPSEANANNNEGGSEMTIYETQYGGNVFSVGSIAFCGALLSDNVISRITKNVLNHFLQMSEKKIILPSH